MTDALNYRRNARLQAERDRRLQALAAKTKRIAVVAFAGAVLLAAVLWFSGCTVSSGCTAALDAVTPEIPLAG